VAKHEPTEKDVAEWMAARLEEFRRLTEGRVVWDRGYRSWRKRQQGDPEGRQVE
jgi:hypothetical protein